GSGPSPHRRYFTGSARVGGGAASNALANSPRNESALNADGLLTMAFTSSSIRTLSPPLRTNWLMKSVARRMGSPSGTPKRRRSFAFMRSTTHSTLASPKQFQGEHHAATFCCICNKGLYEGSLLSEAQFYRGCGGVLSAQGALPE